jgi:hypothetical protein
MRHEPAKTMGGGCLGGLVGAFLGVVLGGFIGSVAAPEPTPTELPIGKGEFAFGEAVARPIGERLEAVLRVVVCAGIGSVIGGIGGAVVGAGLAAKASSIGTAELPSAAGSIPAGVSEPPAESPDAELARLKERVAELEAQQRKDDRFKEG